MEIHYNFPTINISSQNTDTRSGPLFLVFCIWTFVLLCRPQDIFPALAVLRPALLTGILTLVMTVFCHSELGKAPLFQETQVKLYTALLCIMILGIPFSYYSRLSFLTIFTKYINVILFFFLFFKIVNSQSKLLTILLLSTLGVGLYSIFSLVWGEIRFERLYFGGMFDPNDLDFLVLSFLPFNLIFISKGNALWKRLACTASFIAGILVVLVSGSRGGIIAFIIVITMFFLRKTRTIKASTKVILLILCSVFIFLNLSKITISRYQTLINIQDDYNVWDETGRFNIWKIGMKAMLDNPITGVGVGCFNEAIGKDRERRGLPTQYWQAPHNMLVQIGTETGIIGLILFILLTANVFRIFKRAGENAYSIEIMKIVEMGRLGFWGQLISGMFLSHAYSVYWPFYLVLSAVVNRLITKEQETKHKESLMTGVLKK